jgi:hypothetical protein
VTMSTLVFPVIAVAGSVVVATLVVVLISRIVCTLDSRHAAGRDLDGELDREWWPRFERQFAAYVEQLR